MKKVKVVWMDGQERTWTAADAVSVDENSEYLSIRSGANINGYGGTIESVPLRNVRTWTEPAG